MLDVYLTNLGEVKQARELTSLQDENKTESPQSLFGSPGGPEAEGS